LHIYIAMDVSTYNIGLDLHHCYLISISIKLQQFSILQEFCMPYHSWGCISDHALSENTFFLNYHLDFYAIFTNYIHTLVNSDQE
jgi:hypothetical protein